MKVLVLENETCFDLFIVLIQKGNVGLVGVVFDTVMSERFRFVICESGFFPCRRFVVFSASFDSSDVQNAAL